MQKLSHRQLSYYLLEQSNSFINEGFGEGLETSKKSRRNSAVRRKGDGGRSSLDVYFHRTH
jgi:hypothetical protein